MSQEDPVHIEHNPNLTCLFTERDWEIYYNIQDRRHKSAYGFRGLIGMCYTHVQETWGNDYGNLHYMNCKKKNQKYTHYCKTCDYHSLWRQNVRTHIRNKHPKLIKL